MSIENWAWAAIGAQVGFVACVSMIGLIWNSTRLSRPLVRVARALRPTTEPADRGSSMCWVWPR